uniref:Uncharacterized protein n=1 Tax=Anguilla anguilla TaxID=7936 RepID=A0A0E9Q1P7_ANGAN
MSVELSRFQLIFFFTVDRLVCLINTFEYV